MSILRRRADPMHDLADGLLSHCRHGHPTGATSGWKGLVSVRPALGDARIRLVSLTDRGRSTFEAAVPEHLEAQRRALRTLTPAQQSELADLLALLLADLGTTIPTPDHHPRKARRAWVRA